MRIATSHVELELPAGQSVGFVPTMGALHEGHLSLIRKAKTVTDHVVVSIFVNPTQFGPNEDFSQYPRPLEADLALAEGAGADVVYVPDVVEIYGPDQVWVDVDGVSARWEGEWRPGHFRGVATVVAKLFALVRPTDAFFGQKDLQQCAVIGALIRGLHFPVQLHLEPTLREADGLAMSSRNRYLSTDERQIATTMPRGLSAALESIAQGSTVAAALDQCVSLLTSAGFDVQYVAYVDPTSMEPLSVRSERGRIIAAAKLGTTRLIDNLGHGESF